MADDYTYTSREKRNLLILAEAIRRETECEQYLLQTQTAGCWGLGMGVWQNINALDSTVRCARELDLRLLVQEPRREPRRVAVYEGSGGWLGNSCRQLKPGDELPEFTVPFREEVPDEPEWVEWFPPVQEDEP